MAVHHLHCPRTPPQATIPIRAATTLNRAIVPRTQNRISKSRYYNCSSIQLPRTLHRLLIIFCIILLNERNPTLQKRSKFVKCALTCVIIKFCCTQIRGSFYPEPHPERQEKDSTFNFDGQKFSTKNNSMRHRRICFIFEALNSAHELVLYKKLSKCGASYVVIECYCNCL